MGGLVRARDETEDQVRRVNEAFNILHGHGFKLKMGVMLERTVRFILRQKSCQDIDIKIVRLFSKVKFFYRLKCINLKVKYSKRVKNKSLRDSVKISHQMYWNNLQDFDTFRNIAIASSQVDRVIIQRPCVDGVRDILEPSLSWLGSLRPLQPLRSRL